MTAPQLQRFTVLAVHPHNGTAYDVELVASSERYAISRTRGTLYHRDQDVAWLNGTFTVTNAVPL